MEISTPNEFGAITPGHEEIVARHGRSFAAVNVALCEDGLYRCSTSQMYSYGGFTGPVFIGRPGFTRLADAITAGLDELLRRWHTPFPSEPQSVHEELNDMRRQLEAKLRQPSLF
jgi:hypothetical protein